MLRRRLAFKAAYNLAHRTACVNACELGDAQIVAAVAPSERCASSPQNGPACEVVELKFNRRTSGDRAKRAAIRQVQRGRWARVAERWPSRQEGL
jgi:hypothetical protein